MTLLSQTLYPLARYLSLIAYFQRMVALRPSSYSGLSQLGIYFLFNTGKVYICSNLEETIPVVRKIWPLQVVRQPGKLGPKQDVMLLLWLPSVSYVTGMYVIYSDRQKLNLAMFHFFLG